MKKVLLSLALLLGALMFPSAADAQDIHGDVNGDGQVNISDATALINYLLTNNATGINLDAANCDQDGAINISDATTLINYLLSGTWPEAEPQP